METGWKQICPGEWRRTVNAEDRAYVSALAGGDRHIWQAFRGVGHVSGTCGRLSEAMSQADEQMERPLAEFNDAAAAKVIAEINALQERLNALTLCGKAQYDPNYARGFAAGAESVRAAVIAAIGATPAEV